MGLHQGSALSPRLFVIIIYVITEVIEEGTPWTLLFADDLVLCDSDREMMELRLERWRECMEKNGLKVSRSKTEHLQTTGDTDPVRMKRYMDIRNDQLANSPMTKAWSKWRELSDLRQENSNKIEAPDISDSDYTDFALRMRNMANVSQR